MTHLSLPETYHLAICEPCEWAGEKREDSVDAATDAQRHDVQEHDGDLTAETVERELVTDGGEEYQFEYDPRHLPRHGSGSPTPAVIGEHTESGTERLSVADASVHDSGAVRFREWSGRVGYLPEWRWTEVKLLETEVWHGPDEDQMPVTRVTAEDWHLLADAVREAIENPHGKRLVTDGGQQNPVADLLGELDDASETNDPNCLLFANEYRSCVVRWGDEYRYLSSGILYARRCKEEDIRAEWDNSGVPDLVQLSTQSHRFDREDFDDVADLVNHGGVE